MHPRRADESASLIYKHFRFPSSSLNTHILNYGISQLNKKKQQDKYLKTSFYFHRAHSKLNQLKLVCAELQSCLYATSQSRLVLWREANCDKRMNGVYLSDVSQSVQRRSTDKTSHFLWTKPAEEWVRHPASQTWMKGTRRKPQKAE